MTPQVATRLELQDETALLEPKVRRRRPGAPGAVATPFRVRAVPAADVGTIEIEERPSASIISREAIHRRLLGAADAVAVAVSQIAVLSLFNQHNVGLAALGGMMLVLLLFKVAGLYDRDDLRVVHSTLDEVPLLTQLTGLFALSVAVMQNLVLTGTLQADQIAALWFVSFAAILVGRGLARSIAGRLAPGERCLVIGDAGRVERIREKLVSSQSGATVVGSLRLAGEEVDHGDWFAMPRAIQRIVRELNVHRIIIAPTTTDSSGVVNLIRIAKAVGVRVSVLPRMFEVVGSAVEFDNVDGMTMLGVRRFGLSRSSRLLKRTFDIVVTSVAIVLLSPIILAIMLAIRIDSRGPIFFRQVRVGRDDLQFGIFKFRSMVVDAEARKDELRALNEAGNGLFKITDDPRITTVGRFLRNTSLDELPQLFNVLRGEMSLVGPRPLVVDEDAQVVGLDRSRLHLTPGMTGPWQVMGARVPMQEMVGVDYLYVANWSLWQDLKILLRTVRHVARRGNV